MRICFLFVATLSMCLFAGKDIKQKHCCSNPKIPRPANKYLLKVSGRTLKQDVKSVNN